MSILYASTVITTFVLVVNRPTSVELIVRLEETEEALGGLDLSESRACVVHHTLWLTYTHLDALIFIFVTRLTAES
jgi:hypothetical protein